MAVGLVQLLVVGLLVVALRDGGGHEAGEASAVERSTSANASPLRTTTSSLPGGAVATGQTSTSAPGRAGAAVSKTARCASSPPDEATPPPEDWADYWKTKPDDNEPLTTEVCVDDVSPAIGQSITLTVTAEDADASISDGDCDISVRWDGEVGGLCRDTIEPTPEPETTPSKTEGRLVKKFTYTYTKSGTYLVDVEVWSGPSNRRHPYASAADARLTLTVVS